MLEMFETENEFGTGVVKSWASILDDKTREQAAKISRVPILDGHLALMPDAHFGYGPPVGSVIKTRGAVMPYAVGVDIGCGMIAVQTTLERGSLVGLENAILRNIRDFIPSGMGKARRCASSDYTEFKANHGLPQGILGDYLSTKRGTLSSQRQSLEDKIALQFGTLGSGNHFVEVCEDADGRVWLVLHSGSRGIGNVLATAHQAKAREECERDAVPLEDKEFAFFYTDSPGGEAYIADMLWSQEYALAQRSAMMNALINAVSIAVRARVPDIYEAQRINCHHNYAEELVRGVWLTRKGAINAEEGTLGIIPGSMGAATHIVRGLGEPESYQTAPHGAGRLMSRGQARREGNLGAFKTQMKDKTWLLGDAETLLDEAPTAYKPIEVVMADSDDLVETITVLSQFINYKGV